MPSLILPFSLSHKAAAVDSADRSPRPTSAPAIAQSQVTESSGTGSKAQKETERVAVEGEEVPPEQAEPTEVWKVCHKSKYPAYSLSDSEILTP